MSSNNNIIARNTNGADSGIDYDPATGVVIEDSEADGLGGLASVDIDGAVVAYDDAALTGGPAAYSGRQVLGAAGVGAGVGILLGTGGTLLVGNIIAHRKVDLAIQEDINVFLKAHDIEEGLGLYLNIEEVLRGLPARWDSDAYVALPAKGGVFGAFKGGWTQAKVQAETEKLQKLLTRRANAAARLEAANLEFEKRRQAAGGYHPARTHLVDALSALRGVGVDEEAINAGVDDVWVAPAEDILRIAGAMTFLPRALANMGPSYFEEWMGQAADAADMSAAGYREMRAEELRTEQEKRSALLQLRKQLAEAIAPEEAEKLRLDAKLVADLQHRVAELTAASEAAVKERDELRSTLSVAKNQLDAVTKERDSLVTERDALRAASHRNTNYGGKKGR